MKKKNLLIATALLMSALTVSLSTNAAEVLIPAGTEFSGLSGLDGAAQYVNASTSLIVQEGVKFLDNNSSGNGGAISNDGSLNVDGAIFTKNIAQGGGGAIYTQGMTNIINSKFYENESNSIKSGGAIRVNIVGDVLANKVTISNTLFDSNKACGDGDSGAISIANGVVNITNSQFNENTSNWGAGAIYAYLASDGLTIKNSEFIANKAPWIGAVGIFSNVETVISDTLFEKNEATAINDGGGALFLGSESNTVLSNVTFIDNVSATVGGAIATRVAENEGGSKNNNSNALLTIINSTFIGNSAATNGGAIDNYFANGSSVTNTTFTDNSATNGGAIYNHGEKDYTGGISNLKLDSVTMTDNTATGNGGAIFNAADMTINNLTASGNSADGYGGVIYVNTKVNDTQINDSATIITNSNLTGNDASIGGAIFNHNGLLDVKTTQFNNNTANYGGAIYSSKSQYAELKIADSSFVENTALSAGAVDAMGKTSISNTTFTNNSATDPSGDGGGALFLGSESKTSLNNVTFDGNNSATWGGAIATRRIDEGNNSAATLDINQATFTNNSAVKDGGAIYNSFYNSSANAGFVSIKNAVFDNNSTQGNGGAIYNAAADAAGNVSELILTDSSFTNNSAAGNGGAIFASGDATINATGADVVFANNSADDGADIYMNTAGSKLNINAAVDKSITLASGVSGAAYDMVVNSDASSTGSLVVNSLISNAAMDVANGTLHLAEGSSILGSTLNMQSGTTLNTINNSADTFGNNVTLANDVTLAVDVNLDNGTADNFSQANIIIVDPDAKITISKVSAVGGDGSVVNVNLANVLGLNASQLDLTSAIQAETVLTPIRYLQGSVSSDGMLTYAPTGNSYKDFNPAVMASPIAAQLGGYLTQLNSYDQAFRNMDMYMLMTRQQRQALKFRNKYAASDANLVFDPTMSMQEKKSGWFRPYATFENVPLKNGPRVSNVAYGSFFGADSELYDLGHGWEGMFGAYIGYNGSHQSYNGIGVWQNGGTLGAVGVAYKGNFFTGLTVNTGANGGEANTMYGTDNFSMLMAGIASKTGYNFEMADGKFIIQPSFLASYSFVNTFDYTNAAGVKMESDPLHAIQIEPGLKFIGNLENGWQPYLGVSMVWNIMDKTEFMANNVSLPELSVKPFVKYGVGVRKSWGERFTGFIQTYFTNGGRNGVGIQTGFRWAIGEAAKTSRTHKTELKVTQK